MTGAEIAVVAAVVSAAGAAYGAYTAKQTADFNEEMARRESTYQQQKAKYESSRQMERTRRMIAEQKVGFASSGVSLLSGSAEDVFADTLEAGVVDAAIIEYGGDIASEKALVQAQNYSRQGTAAIAGGISSIAGTALTAAK